MKKLCNRLAGFEKMTYLCTRFRKGSSASGKAGRRQMNGSTPYFSHSQAIEKRSLTYWKQKRKQNLSKEKQLKVYINVRGHVKVIKYER